MNERKPRTDVAILAAAQAKIDSLPAAASPSPERTRSTVGGEAALQLLRELVDAVFAWESSPGNGLVQHDAMLTAAEIGRAFLQESAAATSQPANSVHGAGINQPEQVSQEQAGPDPARSFARWFMGQPLQIQGDFIREWHRQHPKVSAEQAAEPGLDLPTLRAALLESFDEEEGYEWRTPGTLDEFTRDVATMYARLRRLRSQQAAEDPKGSALREPRKVLDDIEAWAKDHGMLRKGMGSSDDVSAFLDWYRNELER